MGCIQSAHYHKIYQSKPELAQWESDFETLMFTEADIGAMYYHFRQVDTDGGGTIDVAELLAFLDLEKTKFSKRIFSMFDEDASDDKDSSGEIDDKEVCQMLKDIYGKDFEKNTYAKKILERIFIELGEEITVTEFREFVRKYPALLFPAFQLQDMLQQKIMGADFWKVFSSRRMSLSGDKYIEIGEFMALHVNKGLKENVVGVRDPPGDYIPTPGEGRASKLRQQRDVTGSLIDVTGTVANRRSVKKANSSKLLSPALEPPSAAAGSGTSTADSTPPAQRGIQRRGSNVGMAPLERRASNAGVGMSLKRGKSAAVLPSGGLIKSEVGGAMSGSQQAAAAATAGQAAAGNSGTAAIPAVQRSATTSGFFDDVQTQNTASALSFKGAASVKSAADKWKSKSKKR